MYSHTIVGRENEKDILHDVFERLGADFLAIYGRRRVGKTYLVRNIFNKLPCVYFETTGLKDGTLKEQLEILKSNIEKAFNLKIKNTPKTWFEGLNLLTECIEFQSKDRKIVLFFDELPWIATPRSRFIQALDHFWNTRWSTLPNLKLIVCGSAASWMLENLIRAKGGLHNRLTGVIPLKPFTLYETEQYLHYRGARFNHRQILEIYMAMGGIPHYLNGIEKGLSPAQNINKICFNRNGLLFNEFSYLFESLFNDSSTHIELIRIIADARYGIDKEELLAKAKLSSSGGTFKLRLNELEEAGFITSFIPYMNKKKGVFYRVIDEYTLFYLRWIEPLISKLKLTLQHTNYWESRMQSQEWKIWSGYAFEAICLKHIEQIKEALGIRSIVSEIGSWRYVPRNKTEKGAQIDLMIDRADGIINLCEIKYCNGLYTLSKAVAENIESKKQIFQSHLHVDKSILVTMITPVGLKYNEYTSSLVHSDVILEDLFRKEHSQRRRIY